MRIVRDQPAQRPVGRLANADARGNQDLARWNARALTNEDRRSSQWQSVVADLDAEGGAQFAWAVRQILVPTASRAATTRSHQLDAGQRLERPHEYRARQTLLARHRVEAPVHSIDEVHVGRTWRAIEWLGPPRSSGGGVTGEVVFAQVRLRFDYASTRDTVIGVALEDAAKEVTGDQLRRARVEVSR